MELMTGSWKVNRFEVMPDGSKEPIDDHDWTRFEWAEMTEFGKEYEGRIYRRGQARIDPDDF